MNKATILLICFLSAFVAHGQEPTPPSQEWCKWAFQQLPDHRDISEVDAKAFSVDFYTLLKIAFAINDWFDWNDGMNGSMRKALRGYIRWFADQMEDSLI